MLPPHPWDVDYYRVRIHDAFDRWALAYELRGAGHQAGRYFRELRHLCQSAKARYQALYGVSDEEVDRDATRS